MGGMTLSIPGKNHHSIRITIIKDGMFKMGRELKLTEEQVDLVLALVKTFDEKDSTG